MICKKCSAEMDDKLNFCPKCGAAAERDGAEAAQAVSAEKEMQVATAASDVSETTEGAMSEEERLAASKTYDPPEDEEPAVSVVVPAPPKKRRLKKNQNVVSGEGQEIHKKTSFFKMFPWLLSLALLVALAGVVFVPKLFPSTSVKAYSTPEKAIKATMQYIKDSNVEAALNTMWGYNAKATGETDFVAYTDQLGGMLPYDTMLPENYDVYEQLNSLNFRGMAVQYLKYFYMNSTRAVLSGNIDLVTSSVYNASGKYSSLPEVIADLDPGSARDITVGDIKLVLPSMQNSQSVKTAFQKRCDSYGFDEIREYAVMLTINGEQYLCGVTVVKSGSGWQVYSFTSALAGTNVYRCLVPTTAEDFAALTK